MGLATSQKELQESTAILCTDGPTACKILMLLSPFSAESNFLKCLMPELQRELVLANTIRMSNWSGNTIMQSPFVLPGYLRAAAHFRLSCLQPHSLKQKLGTHLHPHCTLLQVTDSALGGEEWFTTYWAIRDLRWSRSQCPLCLI